MKAIFDMSQTYEIYRFIYVSISKEFEGVNLKKGYKDINNVLNKKKGGKSNTQEVSKRILT